MNILDEIGIVGRGRLAKSVSHGYTRDLTQADLELLLNAEPGKIGAVSSQPLRLRHRHHTLARLLAAGTTSAEISAITGYCTSRISILKGMPAVQELVEYYKGQLEGVYLDVHQRLASLGLEVVAELHDRLENEPEKISTPQLVDVAKLALDRSGYGPVSTQKVQGTVALVPADALDRLKQEANERQHGTLRAIEPPRSAGASVGEVIELFATAATGGEAEGEPS